MMTYDELNRVRALREQLAAEIRRLEALRLSATSLCRQLDGLPRSMQLTSTPEKFTTAIVDSEKRISEITAAIDETATKLATQILCAGLPISEIARRMNYTSNYIWKLQRRGVKILTGAT